MIDTSYQFDFVNPRQSMNEPDVKNVIIINNQ